MPPSEPVALGVTTEGTEVHREKVKVNAMSFISRLYQFPSVLLGVLCGSSFADSLMT